MENRQINEQYKVIAENLIKTEPALQHLAKSEVRIIYLESDLQRKIKTGVVHGVCERIASKNKWAIHADFTITLYKLNNAGFSEDQLKTLLFHELLHVGIEINDEGKESYYCVPHDLEDFKLIINKFGTDWSEVK